MLNCKNCKKIPLLFLRSIQKCLWKKEQNKLFNKKQKLEKSEKSGVDGGLNQRFNQLGVFEGNTILANNFEQWLRTKDFCEAHLKHKNSTSTYLVRHI